MISSAPAVEQLETTNVESLIRQYLGADWKENSDGLLFCTRTGRPLDNYNVVTWQLKPLLERIGVTKTRRMGLHAFRHCNATELDRMGAPIKVRQDRLGHADSETTFGYTHAESADHRRVAAELGRIFDPNTLSTDAVEKPSENVRIPAPTLPQSPVSDRNVREPLLSFVGA